MTGAIFCERRPATIMRSAWRGDGRKDRKSTRLNSSHDQISYAVFCLKKKKKKQTRTAHTTDPVPRPLRRTHTTRQTLYHAAPPDALYAIHAQRLPGRPPPCVQLKHRRRPDHA